MDSIFFQIGFLIILATVGGYIAKLLKQPLIPVYILVGVLIGPILHLIEDVEMITTLSEIGIAFLLFTVGVELDFSRLRDIGSIAFFGTTAAFFGLFVLGTGAGLIIGYSLLVSVYLGIILGFSSTMVVIKILSDKKELDTLHGRISISMLIVQDVIAIICLTLLASIGTITPGQPIAIEATPLIGTFLQGVAIIAVGAFMSKHIFPEVFKFAARSQELLFLLSVSLCFVFSILFNLIGFSIAVGAFIAGVMLANLNYNVEIVSRVRSLKDFFSVLFFTSIGMELVILEISTVIVPLTVLLLFLLIVKPLVIYVVGIAFGYAEKTSFLTAITLAQISEFSLIILAQGLDLFHVDESVLSIAVVLAIVSISTTSYLVNYEKQFYAFMQPYLKAFKLFKGKKKEYCNTDEGHGHKNILVGYDRIGHSLARTLKKLKKSFMVVDYNPEIIKQLMHSNTPCIYGDISDVEVLEHLKLQNVEIIISTTEDYQSDTLLIQKAKQANPDVIIIVTTTHPEDALSMYETGADYVLVPHLVGGDHVSVLLEDFSTNIDALIQKKLTHIKELHRRGHTYARKKSLGHHIAHRA